MNFVQEENEEKKTKLFNFADSVAELCYAKYEELPKTGKPNSKEWTALAGIVKVKGWDIQKSDKCNIEVVALGTGSKCIGQSKLSSRGDVVNDGHAEVMARRGFMRYLYQQVQLMYETGSSDIFCGVSQGKCVLDTHVSFHFFISHTPCGDASIFPKPDVHEDYGPSLHGGTAERCGFVENVAAKDINHIKRKCAEEDMPTGCKMVRYNQEACVPGTLSDEVDVGEIVLMADSAKAKSVAAVRNEVKPEDEQRTDGARMSATPDIHGKGAAACWCNKCGNLIQRTGKDIYRTGAKCVPAGELQDEKLAGVGYHMAGALRTKPGRGDPTLSLSCSDKLARWVAVGVQGALLLLVLAAPVYLRSIVVAGGCPYSQSALKRAVVDRVRAWSRRGPELLLLQSSVGFVDARRCGCQPCPASIVWSAVPTRPHEVCVDGRKQGVTKKSACTPAGRLLVSKRAFLEQCVSTLCVAPNVAGLLPELLRSADPTDVREQLESCTYRQLKDAARTYQESWVQVKSGCFSCWIKKPDTLVQFTLRS